MCPNLIITRTRGANAGAGLARQHRDAVILNLGTRTLLRGDASVGVTNGTLLFVAALLGRPGAVVSVREIASLLYGDDPDGGPECAEHCIYSAKSEAVHALLALGLRIDTHVGRGFSVRDCAVPASEAA